MYWEWLLNAFIRNKVSRHFIAFSTLTSVYLLFRIHFLFVFVVAFVSL